MFFQCWKVGGFNDVGDSLWFISKHEVEWRFASGGVRAVVVDKFSRRDMVSPCFRVRAAEDAEVGFEFLVESFCFPISLGVVCCG